MLSVQVKKIFALVLFLASFVRVSFSLNRQEASVYSAVAGVGVGLVSAGLTYKLLADADLKKEKDVLDDVNENSDDLDILLHDAFDDEEQNKSSVLKKILVSLTVGTCFGFGTKLIASEAFLYCIRKEEERLREEKRQREWAEHRAKEQRYSDNAPRDESERKEFEERKSREEQERRERIKREQEQAEWRYKHNDPRDWRERMEFDLRRERERQEQQRQFDEFWENFFNSRFTFQRGPSEEDKEKACQTLGVSPDAQPVVIRSAYKKLSRKWHPDRCPNRNENSDEYKKYQDNFKDIAQARDILLPNK